MFGGGSCGGDGWVNGCVCVCVCVVGLLVVLWRWFGGFGVRKFTLWWLFLNLLVEYGFLWWFAS